ncbi:MAG: hydrogen peroxide-inducible genes activator [Rhodospirillales bacterium]
MSGQLRELEQKLGVQLVERSRSRVILTPLGKEVAARARILLRDVQGIVALAQHGQTVLGGTLRVGVLQSLGPYLLPHILPELHHSYAGLKLYVREELPQSLLRGLEEGNFDFLLFPLPVKGADLDCQPLFREPLWVVVPRDHRLTAKESVAPADLEGETVMTLERGHRLHGQVRDLCERYGAHLALDYEGTSLDTLRQMVDMGMGLSLLPALYVRSEVLRDTQVVARRLVDPSPARDIAMIWRRQAARQQEYRTLARLFRKVLTRRVPEVTVLDRPAPAPD